MVFIYALQLEQDKWYIGKTNTNKIRIDTHFDSNGSEFTKTYKPLEVYEIIPECDKYDEDKYVKKYMDKYGIDNVRGGTYSRLELTIEEKQLIQKELWGANDLYTIYSKKKYNIVFPPGYISNNDKILVTKYFIKIKQKYIIYKKIFLLMRLNIITYLVNSINNDINKEINLIKLTEILKITYSNLHNIRENFKIFNFVKVSNLIIVDIIIEQFYEILNIIQNIQFGGNLIDSYINNFETYFWTKLSQNKNLTDKFIKKYLDKPLNWYMLSLNKNITIKNIHNTCPRLYLISKYIDKPWDWQKFSDYGKNFITLEFIEQNLDKPWDWKRLSSKENLTIEFIDKYNNKPWEWNTIFGNNGGGDYMVESLTLDFIEKYYDNPVEILEDNYILNNHIDKLPIEYIIKYVNLENENINWSGLSSNPHLTLNFIEKYVDKPWCFTQLLFKNNITLDFVEKYIDKPWHWIDLSKYSKLTEEFLQNHIDKPWDWTFLSYNLSENFIKKYIDKPWNWINLSQNSNISLEFLNTYSNKKWNLCEFSNTWSSNIITLDSIEKNIDNFNDFRFISLNKNITFKFVEKYIHKPWNWKFLSKHLDIKLNFIEKYIDKCWDWTYLSKHPDLTLKFIEKYSTKPWHWGIISIYCNDFTFQYIENYLLKKKQSYHFNYIKYVQLFNKIIIQLHYNYNISIDFICKYIDNYNLNDSVLWAYISKNKNITIQFIEKYYNKPWDWYELSQNPNITYDFIYKFSIKYDNYPLYSLGCLPCKNNKNRIWNILSIQEKDTGLKIQRRDITLEIIEKHIDKPWNWNTLSNNINITIEFIEKHIDKPWNWEILYRKKIINLDFIEKYIDTYFNIVKFFVENSL